MSYEVGGVSSSEMQPQRAVDILAREVPFGDALDFVQGCDVIASIVSKEQPDVVFFPQRGASPIAWTTGVILETTYGDKPYFVDLPLGTHIKINNDEPGPAGIPGAEKRALIDQQLAELQEDGVYIPGESRLMLIDEVQKGGTITQAAWALRLAMYDCQDDSRLLVVAAQDSRHSLIGDERKNSFRKLAANERPGFKTATLPVELFTVDRTHFLDEIWKTTENTIPSLDDYLTNENHRARALFETLARVYLYPNQALYEIEQLRRQELTPYLSGMILQDELLEILTDPRPIKYNKGVKDVNLLKWWEQYTQAALGRRS